MTTLHSDYSEFIALLNGASVKYVLVGADALAHHGFARQTGDIDFFLSDDAENLVLETFGVPPGTFTRGVFEESDGVQVGYAPVRIDLLTSLSRVNFETVWRNRVETEIEGMPVHVIGLQEFITNKEAVGRPQDLADAAKARELMQ